MEIGNEDWVPLNGCNTCVNTHVCNALGNCVVLSVDQAIPEYSKAKRKLLTKIRVYGNGSMEQIHLIFKKAKKVQIKKEDAPPRLTRIERLFVDKVKEYGKRKKEGAAIL